jgi:hypothetical protein
MTVYPRIQASRFRHAHTQNFKEVLIESKIPGSDSAMTLKVDAQPLIGVKAFRQGALNVALTRAAGEADTTWDGNPDTGVNVIARTNATGNVASQGAIRGMSVQGRNSGTNISWILALNLNGRNDSGKTADQIHGMDVRCENYGNVNTEIVGIDVNLSDENDGGVHTKYGVRVRNTDQSAQGAADAALHVSHTSTNGFSAFAHLATNSGDGAVASTTTPSGAATEALIVKIGSNLRYIPCYAAVGFGG